eukprot:11492306-Karenia_brevis.AAC.1
MASPTPLQTMLLDGVITPTAGDSEGETADMKTVNREANTMAHDTKNQRESETASEICPVPSDDDLSIDNHTKNLSSQSSQAQSSAQIDLDDRDPGANES